MFQSVDFVDDAEIILLVLMLFNCTYMKTFCGLSWDKQFFAAFIVALCQLEISNGSFTFPRFLFFNSFSFFSLIVLSSLFDVPYYATFHSPASCSSNRMVKSTKLVCSL